jgi:hypothetical protein
MTQNAFANQYLSPHGIDLMRIMGKYYALKFASQSMDLAATCTNIVVYADGSSQRDVDSAVALLEGFGCPSVPVFASTANTSLPYSDMFPVVDDHWNGMKCPLATQSQVESTFAGDVSVVTTAYSTLISKVQSVLQMPTTAGICSAISPGFNPATPCTLFNTGYNYTGMYWNGMFMSPLGYAQYFAELWMLEYCNNVTNWGLGALSIDELRALYEMHTKTLDYGGLTNNALAYGSHQLAYILASFDEIVYQQELLGVPQSLQTKWVLLVSHDFNLVWLQKLLNVNWITNGFGFDITSTGMGVSFQLFKTKNSAGSASDYYVRMQVESASPDQQRQKQKLTLSNPPGHADILIPGCGDIYCPYATFKSILLKSVSSSCINTPLQQTIVSMQSGQQPAAVNQGYTLGTVVLSSAITFIVVMALFALVYMYRNGLFAQVLIGEDKSLMYTSQTGGIPMSDSYTNGSSSGNRAH